MLVPTPDGKPLRFPILVVGGTFDANGGKPSSIVRRLGEALRADVVLNGGHINTLHSIVKHATEDKYPRAPDLLIWMPNVDNSEEKILSQIKERNPKLFLVSSKRVIEKEYTEGDVIGRLLKSHSNMGIMITKPGDRFHFKLLDPLGNLWADTEDVEVLAAALRDRFEFLKTLVRVPSVSVGPKRDSSPVPPEFVEVVRELGTCFAKFVNAVNPNRLLGNAATRCSYGFPGVKADGRIFVTRRNVEKTTLSPEDFVEVQAGPGGCVQYYGDKKPSVDSPIQVRLFDYFTNIRYMVHGHVYLEDAKLTKHKLPCGYVEEFDEIVRLCDKGTKQFALNLRGHGCLLAADRIDFLRDAMPWLIARPFPEAT